MAKPKKEVAKPKTDIDFERELWKAANELRGAVAENQYKDYVLSLIFLKHMSERYEARRDELQKNLNDPPNRCFFTDTIYRCGRQFAIFVVLAFLCTGSACAQILTKKQEEAIKKTISNQFGSAADQIILNSGAATFCIAGADTLYNPSGYNYLFRLRGDSIERRDHSLFHGNNGRRFLFSWKNKLYTLGGYGFFTTNNNLNYFNNESKEWCFEPTHGELPPAILGITFKSGNLIYSFNNYKSGNNAEADVQDLHAYCLDLESMTWKRFAPLKQIPWQRGEAYYTRDYLFFHRSNTSLLIHPAHKKFLIIQNDEYGISPSAQIASVNENSITILKHDNKGTPQFINLSLTNIWKHKLKEIQALSFEPIGVKTSSGLLWTLALAGLFFLFVFFQLYRRTRRQKKYEALSQDKEEAVNSIQELAAESASKEHSVQPETLGLLLHAEKSMLTNEELDELFKIAHLEPDSRKLRRHRLLSELQKEYPELITRVKDSADRRRFLYKINKDQVVPE